MASQERIEHLRRVAAHILSPSQSQRSELTAPSHFRSTAASDLACILEFNPAVVSWSSTPPALNMRAVQHIADFEMLDDAGTKWMLDAPDRAPRISIERLSECARRQGYKYRLVHASEIYDGYRLQNILDLMRYRGHSVPLGDRMRILGALSENGPLTFADCLRVIRETQPVAAMASLILQGILNVEMDDALLGPETMVRRIGD